MKRLLKITLWSLGLVLACYGLLWLTPFRYSLPGYHRFFYTPEAYQKTIVAFQKEVKQNASSTTALAQHLQRGVSEELFPYWQGTRWAFHGTTQTPGKGRIACGYFVTTVLRDCGVKIDRSRCAQLASEAMIRELLDKENITTYSKKPLASFLSEVKQKGTHLYLIGLDSHVGFLSVEKEETWFIHSSGRYPWAVVKERATESIVLEKSNYRVVGSLTADKRFLENWKQALH